MTQTQLEQRVTALESELGNARKTLARTHRMIVAAVAGVPVLLLVAMTGQPTTLDVIRAKRLEIIGDDGTPVLVASAGVNGGQLDLWGAEGLNIMRMWSNDQGGDLAIWNNQGANVFGAYATEQGGRAALWNAAGEPAITAFSDEVGGRIEFAASGISTPMLTAGVDANGGRIALANGHGMDQFVASCNAAGADLSLAASDGRSLWTTRATDDGCETLMRNHNGQPVVSVSCDEAGNGMLNLADAAGLSRFQAGLAQNGDVLRVLGDAQTPVMSSGAGSASNGGFVNLYNGQGERVLRSFVDRDGAGRLDLADEQGNAVFSVDAIPGTGAAMALFDTQGRRLFLVGAGDHGGLLNVMNDRGHVVVIAGASEDGLSGVLSVKNDRGRTVIHASPTDDGDGQITLLNADGRRQTTIPPSP